jgi:hypothetical protein
MTRSSDVSRRSTVATSLIPALSAGGFQAVFFNPYDRALYLRVQNRNSFFHHSNWTHPFQGFANSALYRTVASATYLFWQDEAARALSTSCPDLEPSRRRFLVGVIAGSLNGIVLNPMQLVKFHMWSSGGEATFGTAFRNLRGEGARIFGRGVGVSMMRDVTFGVTYEVLRRDCVASQSSAHRLLLDCAAGMVASVASSPFNFARTLIFGAPASGCPLSTSTLLQFLVKETIAIPTSRAKWRHLNARLNIGWGTIRVGCGMACGQYVFRAVQSRVS